MLERITVSDALPAHVTSDIESVCPEDLFVIPENPQLDEMHFVDTEFGEDTVDDITAPWLSWCIA